MPKEINTFYFKLLGIKQNLDKYKFNQVDAFEIFVKQRLNKALDSYIKDMNLNVEYLSRRSNLRVLNMYNKDR